jgi:DNA-binding protein YbaB
VDNDAMRHEVGDLLARVQDQMRDLSEMQQKRSTLAATASVADGTVEVTVNAQNILTDVTIHEDYLNDYEFADLGGYITDAVQAAGAEMQRQSTAMVAPLLERRQSLSLVSGLAADIPELQQLLSGMNLPASLFPPGVAPAPEADGDLDTENTTRR